MRVALGWFCALVALALSFSLAQAQDAEPADAKLETVVSGLTNPAGIALQPETGVVFVADSGAGRVCRIVDGKLEAVIEGSPTESSGEGGRAVGPLGLVFVDKQTLAVGDGGYKSGEDTVRIFKLPTESMKALEYEQGATTKLKPVASRTTQTVNGDFSTLALAKHGLYAINAGGSGTVLKAGLKGTKFSELEPVIDVAQKVEGVKVSAITLSSRGEVVLGLHSSSADSPGCKIVFFSAKSNESLLQLETALSSISALAYSPKTGLLYALGSAADEPTKFGLFRLDSDTTSGLQRIKSTRIASLDQPNAMAFDKEGTAYITVGKADAGSDRPSGAVVKIGGL